MSDGLENKIERYLLARMSEEEAKQFEKELEKNSSLKEEVELTALIIGSARKIGAQNEKSAVTEESKAIWDMLKETSTDDVKRLTGKKRTSILTWVTSGAAAVILLLVALHFYRIDKTHEELYAAYYKPYEDDLAPHRGINSMDEIATEMFDKALKYYNTQQYRSALDLFNNIDIQYTHHIAIYQSICMLETGQTKDAIDLLSFAIQEYGEGWEYFQDAEWYLALAYLKDNQEDQTIDILARIIEFDRYYADEAKDLLDVLKSS